MPIIPLNPLRRPAVRLCLSLLAAFSPAAAGLSAVEDLESVIKVEFIERFTEYVEWPAETFDSASSTFNLCTVGDGPLVPRIGKILSKSRMKKRPVSIRALKAEESASGCHLLYIAPSENSRLERTLKQLDGSPVLTIGDTAGFGKRGVMINLFIEGTHVRFKINTAASKANGLNVSAKLLVLARPSESGD